MTAELRPGEVLTAETVGLLKEGDLLRYNEEGDVLDRGALVAFEGLIGRLPMILIDWIGDGTNSAGGWEPSSFTFIGRPDADGWRVPLLQPDLRQSPAAHGQQARRLRGTGNGDRSADRRSQG